MGESKRRDRRTDMLVEVPDLFPTGCRWLIVRFVGAGIASWLVVGALGFAVFWALS